MPDIRSRIYRHALDNRIPITGAFEVSPICNFTCRMCYVRKNGTEVQNMGGLRPLEFWQDIARQAREAGTVFPLLTGGEPFLYPHIRELYEAMIKMGMQVSINSNGSCITEENIAWLREMPPVRINVTIYGGSAETYERLCGDPQGFEKMRRGVELLAGNGITFRFNCSLTPDNCEDLDKMLEFARGFDRGLRVGTYMFPPVRRTGKAGDYEERLSPAQAAYYSVLADYRQLPPEQFNVLAQNAQHYTELTPEALAEAAAKPSREMSCMSGRCSYWIDWQGNLTGCGMFDYPTFNLTEQSLREAWEKIVAWTQEMRYGAVCANCVNRTVCFSCAAMVHNETGSFEGRPVYLCEKAKYAARYYKEFMAAVHSQALH